MITDLKKVVESWGLQDKLFVKEELALCTRCGGTGDKYQRTHQCWLEPCDECNATGRIYKQTLNLTGFRPFKEAGDGN